MDQGKQEREEGWGCAWGPPAFRGCLERRGWQRWRTGQSSGQIMAVRDGGRGRVAGQDMEGKRRMSLPRRKKGASVSQPSPRHGAEDRQETQRPGEVLGVAGAQDHPPLLADEQEEKRHQARDERQADPDDGPGVIAGPCRGEPGRVKGGGGEGYAASQPWPQAQSSGGPLGPGVRPPQT